MQDPKDILYKYWGFDRFRSVQEEIINDVLNSKDVLALLPTGGGKSICYQLPALMKEGVCLVISPLIALMKDQVDHLRSRGIKADAVYSGMHYREIERIMDNAIFGDTKLLYISPERLFSEKAMGKIAQMNLSFIAVDEAHCISQWGHDFRPSYLKINTLKEIFPEIHIIAVTATATPKVVTDICKQLELINPVIHKTGFTRSNLSYAVLHEEVKLVKLLDLVKKIKSSGLVYVRNRKETRDIAAYLIRNGIKAEHYHAGLSSSDRFKRQEQWVRNEVRIMVCTNAFGMGIDKPDVRFVIHMNLPETLEAYFQEAGRAGRDLKKAYAILLYNVNDKKLLQKHYDQSYPTIEVVRNVYHALGSFYQIAEGAAEGISFDFDMVSFARNFKFESIVAYSALKVLEQAGWISLSDSFFQPPRIWIPVSMEKLYNYQLQNPDYEKLISGILRLHQGIFQQEVRLEEIKLNKITGLDINEIRKMLSYLDKLELIVYYPKKDQAQLTFLRPRIDSKLLTIDKEKYNFLKERAKEKLEAAFDYVDSRHCRNISLLNYFGEKSSETCGVCDICVANLRSKKAGTNIKELEQSLLKLLKEDKQNMKSVLALYKNEDRKLILDLLQQLVNEEIIRIEDGEKIVLSR